MTATGDDDLASQARALLQRQQQGVLSTISVHRSGYPYGSMTPYALSRRGEPLILISTLAAHTQNLLADPRASLFVAAAANSQTPDFQLWGMSVETVRLVAGFGRIGWLDGDAVISAAADVSAVH